MTRAPLSQVRREGPSLRVDDAAIDVEGDLLMAPEAPSDAPLAVVDSDRAAAPLKRPRHPRSIRRAST